MCAIRKQKNKSRQKKGGAGKTIRKRGSEKKQKNTTRKSNHTHTFTFTQMHTLPTPSPQTSSSLKTPYTQHTQLHTYTIAYIESLVLRQVVLKTIDIQQTKHIVLSIVCFASLSTPCTHSKQLPTLERQKSYPIRLLL